MPGIASIRDSLRQIVTVAYFVPLPTRSKLNTAAAQHHSPARNLRAGRQGRPGARLLKMKQYRLIGAIFAFSTFMLSGLFGQNSGALKGRVTAASGESVPSASVMITGSPRFARNPGAGHYGSFT